LREILCQEEARKLAALPAARPRTAGITAFVQFFGGDGGGMFMDGGMRLGLFLQKEAGFAGFHSRTCKSAFGVGNSPSILRKKGKTAFF